ncbi:uncharacterized protein KIAA1671 homolog [Notothenia coriiceps]|uniref:Uncharacterized protein KIAA1671 homolog n=1 Tax=Notothenia coriiceps TaxID=8208 RepID=A0A6I9PXW9_9TELE|nr:PREDICTED: uncharacterized protein KIAA1671 homolog [Notothenia coriiceps]
MQYFGGKMSAAQLQVAGWVGSVRRSLQGALELVWGPAEDTQKKEEEDKVDEVEEEQGGDGEGSFQRAMTPLRSFARRSRRSLRRFSDRSRQTLQRRGPETCSAPVNTYSPTGEDTDALIDSQPEQQNGACERTPDNDSPEPVPDEVPEEPSGDPDTTDFSRVPEQAPFPESSTPLLDTSAQRSKADLGKRRSRSRPPLSMRGGFSFSNESQDWRAQDTTDEKKASSKQRDSDSEEEQPKPKIARSPPPSQRVPMFTGLNPASLIAQLKRRTGGVGTRGGEEKEENKESRNEEAAPSPSKPSRSPRPAARSPRPAARTPLPAARTPRPADRSPRPAAHLPGAARVLPPIGGGGGGSVSSPAWLKELKSKKRLSQHDSEA